MKKDISEKLSLGTALSLNDLLSQIENQNEKSQREQIDLNSPYSQEVNQYITTYKELCFYCDIGLKEIKLTRTSLIRKIDFDLWVSCKNKTNRDLMKGGNPPFAFDSPDGAIELHHVGQSQNSPFAELTNQEHCMRGNKKTFHNDKNESWRKIPGAEDAFNQERKKHWEMRAAQESLCLNFAPIKLTPVPFTENEILTANILDLIKRLFRECSADTLNYIADEAKLAAIIKSMGISSFSELLEINLEDQKKRCVQLQ